MGPTGGDTMRHLFIALRIFAGTPPMITHQPVRLPDEQPLHLLSAFDWLKTGNQVRIQRGEDPRFHALSRDTEHDFGRQGIAEQGDQVIA